MQVGLFGANSIDPVAPDLTVGKAKINIIPVPEYKVWSTTNELATYLSTLP